MLQLPIVSYWTTLINLIIHNYLFESTSICMLWNENIEFELHTVLSNNENFVQFVHIFPQTLQASFDQDIYNYNTKREHFLTSGLMYDDIVMKLTVAIEHTHCESFIVFQEQIPIFARAFRNASMFSLWRSQRTKFLFAYRKDLQIGEYFDDFLFQDQPNILIIEAPTHNSSVFDLKTNKFVGSIHNHPEELYVLDQYDAIRETFRFQRRLYPDKIKDLQGREIIVGAFDYRPFVVYDYERMPQTYDYAEDNPSHSVHIDGTEVRVLLSFCEIYNCTVQTDTTEKGDWGTIYPNISGNGLLGMIVDRKSHYGVCAMYHWYIYYIVLDLTAFLGRSGVTLLVPKPTRLTSWNLPLKPFQMTLWFGVLGCLILETLSLLVTRRLEEIMEKHKNSSWLTSLQFGYITTLKLFISQGSDYIVNSTSVRTVLFSCYMIDIIVTSIYSGGLASILTLPTLSEAADSLERLYKHNILWTASDFNWIVAIRDAKDDPVIEGVLQNYRINTIDDMRKMAKTENMGFILERMSFGHFGNGEFLTPESLNRLKLMTDDIYYQFTIAFVPRLWAFLNKFNHIIYAWHSSGMDKIWEWKVTADFLNVRDHERIQASMTTNFDAGPVELDMANFAGLILVWFIGMALSTIAFALELICQKYYNAHMG